MKLRFVVFMGLILGCAIAGADAQEAATPPARRISLEEAYQSARARTETEGLQVSEVEQSHQRLAQARAGILPSLVLNGTYTRQQMPPAYFVSACVSRASRVCGPGCRSRRLARRTSQASSGAAIALRFRGSVFLSAGSG